MWQCACRELKEETGLASGDFHQIGYEVWPGTHCIYSSFLCTVDCDKNTVTLQEGETEDYRWLSEAEFAAFVSSGKMIPAQKRRLGNWLREMGYLSAEVAG